MNAYSKGFTDLEQETVVHDLPIQGAMPDWLSGNLLRTGPAKFTMGSETMRHWFDGYAMLHSFTFDHGSVSYANAFLQSDDYRASLKKQGIAYREFATDPCRSIFKKFFTIFDPQLTDNGNVNISRIAGEYVALTETPLPVVFDPELLETKGHFRFDDEITGQVSTAHPHYDAHTKEAFNYVVNLSYKSEYVVYRITDGSATREVLARVPIERPSYMHSFAITTQYVILVEWPLVLNPVDMLLSDKPFIENYRWDAGRQLRFILIHRESGEVHYRTSPETHFAFHHINAFETVSDDGNDVIVMDIATYPDPSLIQDLYLHPLLSDHPHISRPEFRRFTIPLSTAHREVSNPDITLDITSEIIVKEPVELPRLNYERHNGRDYRYAYGASFNRDGDFLNQLVKIDVVHRSALTWHEPGMYPGEPVFVAKPGATEEDDGVILCVALDTARQRSALVVLDAHSFAEVARVMLPHHIPFGFHGNFYR